MTRAGGISNLLHNVRVTFHAVAFVAAVLAGAIAALSGFGIGSVLTPLIAIRLGTRLAVAVVTLPHFIGTAARFAGLRRHVDRRILVQFGTFSAAGGLAGALLHTRLESRLLTIVFGALLLLTGTISLARLTERIHLGRIAASFAGALSGFFGGLVGNQGGIRSGALLGFDTPKESFVATATAVALLVDAARLPVYLATEGGGMAAAVVPILVMTCGVLAGTFLGVKILRRIPDRIFRPIVAILVLLLGAYMLARG